MRGVAGYVTIAAVRGEIGASMMKSRILESMLNYVRETLTGTFKNVKKYMNHDIQVGKGEWFKTAAGYREKLNITWDDLKGMEKKDLKNLIKKWDTNKWLEEVLLHRLSLK